MELKLHLFRGKPISASSSFLPGPIPLPLRLGGDGLSSDAQAPLWNPASWAASFSLYKILSPGVLASVNKGIFCSPSPSPRHISRYLKANMFHFPPGSISSLRSANRHNLTLGVMSPTYYKYLGPSLPLARKPQDEGGGMPATVPFLTGQSAVMPLELQ